MIYCFGDILLFSIAQFSFSAIQILYTYFLSSSSKCSHKPKENLVSSSCFRVPKDSVQVSESVHKSPDAIPETCQIFLIVLSAVEKYTKPNQAWNIIQRLYNTVSTQNCQNCLGVWILFFKKCRENSILLHSPLAEITCQLCWMMAWFSMGRKQTGTDLSLLEVMSSTGSKPISLGCQGGCVTLCINWSPYVYFYWCPVLCFLRQNAAVAG